MKVTIKTSVDEYTDEELHDIRVDLVDGSFTGRIIGHVEPEDAIIGRDLVDAYELLKYLKMGYEAGRNGEPLEVEEIKVPYEEF